MRGSKRQLSSEEEGSSDESVRQSTPKGLRKGLSLSHTREMINNILLKKSSYNNSSEMEASVFGSDHRDTSVEEHFGESSIPELPSL